MRFAIILAAALLVATPAGASPQDPLIVERT